MEMEDDKIKIGVTETLKQNFKTGQIRRNWAIYGITKDIKNNRLNTNNTYKLQKTADIILDLDLCENRGKQLKESVLKAFIDIVEQNGTMEETVKDLRQLQKIHYKQDEMDMQ